jgi:hypothetical protein
VNPATHTQTHGTQQRPIWRRFLRRVEDDVHHLHEIEVEGESPATPAISIAQVLLVVVPVFAVMVGLAFAAYYLIV